MAAFLQLALCLSAPVAVLASNGGAMLRRSRSHNAVQQAQAQLGQSMSGLAEALAAEYPGLDLITAGDIVRSRLAQEAATLARRDAQGGALFSDYAQRAPIAVLVMPVNHFGLAQRSAEDPVQGRLTEGMPYEGAFLPMDSRFIGFLSGNGVGRDPNTPSQMVWGTSESSESVMRSDGDGNTVIQTKHCKDGDCEQSTERRSGNTAKDGKGNSFMDRNRQEMNSDDMFLSDFMHENQHLNAAEDSSSALRGAVERMARDMAAIHNDFGKGTLDNMMKGVLSAAANSGSTEDDNGTKKVDMSVTKTISVGNNGDVKISTEKCTNGECIKKLDKVSKADATGSELKDKGEQTSESEKDEGKKTSESDKQTMEK